jgi:hypothetical protein
MQRFSAPVAVHNNFYLVQLYVKSGGIPEKIITVTGADGHQ